MGLFRKEVTGGKVPRGWNSTGPPRASTMATPYREPRIRDGNDMIGRVIMNLMRRKLRLGSSILTAKPFGFRCRCGLPQASLSSKKSQVTNE